jgi:putative endonuclease
MAQHNQLGKEGERLAKIYLLNKGHVILEENWRCGKIEIDLISDQGEMIVLTEVKTRSTLEFGNPEEAVDEDKELAMINAADIYLRNLHLDVEVRFDIIAVVIEGGDVEINHIEDAFTATYL